MEGITRVTEPPSRKLVHCSCNLAFSLLAVTSLLVVTELSKVVTKLAGIMTELARVVTELARLVTEL